MHINDFDMDLFASDVPERLREAAFTGMVWSKASYWMLMEGNLRERPSSPNVRKWEQAQQECEDAMAYWASYVTRPIDGKAIVEFYTTTGSVRTYPEDAQATHIANVAKLHGISIEEATARVEKADAAQAKENKELKWKLHDQLNAIANKLEHGITKGDPLAYDLTTKDLETFLVKLVEKGEALKERMDQLVDRVRRPELQAGYKAVNLEVERKLKEVSALLLEVMQVSGRDEREAEASRPVEENNDRAMA